MPRPCRTRPLLASLVCARQRSLKPKFQLWLPCDFSSESSETQQAEVSFPYEVALRPSAPRLGGDVALTTWTSSEVALFLCRQAPSWTMQRLQIQIPHRQHLISHVVLGRIGGEEELGPAPESANVNDEWKAFRGSSARDRHIPQRKPGASSGASSSSQGPARHASSAPGAQPRPTRPAEAATAEAPSGAQQATVAPAAEAAALDDVAPDEAHLACVDEDPLEILSSIGDVNLSDIVVALVPEDGVEGQNVEASGVAGSSNDLAAGTAERGAEAAAGPAGEQLGAASATPANAAQDAAAAPPPSAVEDAAREEDEPPAPPAPFCPNGTDIEGPSGLCYLYRGGRSVARVNTAMKGGNVAVRCFLHSGVCSLLVGRHHLPPMAEIKRWIAQAELVEEGEPRQEATAKARRRIEQFKSLRDRCRA